jgi:hypothetical protein
VLRLFSCAGDTRLDVFYEALQGSADGVLDEEHCERLVEDIDQPVRRS